MGEPAPMLVGDHPERLDAYRLLRRQNISVSEVVSCDRDSVLFLDRDGKPMTAWLAGQQVLGLEEGFAV